eukprot:1400043-Pyramimonas_sp.AAC.1
MLLQGSHIAMRDLIEKDRIENLVVADRTVDAIDFGLAPRISEVACIFARMRPMVGISEDCNGSELFKAAPLETARLFHPLVFKSVVSLRPPLQWKGGHLFEIYKGAMTEIPSYRDVTICEAASKLLPLHMRSRGMPALAATSSNLQFGGGLNG